MFYFLLVMNYQEAIYVSGINGEIHGRRKITANSHAREMLRQRQVGGCGPKCQMYAMARVAGGSTDAGCWDAYCC